MLMNPVHRVIDNPRARTAAKAGLSHQESRLIEAAARILRRMAKRYPLKFTVASAPGLGEREARRFYRTVKSRIADGQRRAGMRNVIYLEVLESEEGVHSNLIYPDPGDIEGALNRSPKFKALDDERGTFIDSQPVNNLNSLLDYLRGECTPQAHYADNRRYPRLPGSHPLGEGGGDRVRLSTGLNKALASLGEPPRQRTYASRAISRAKPTSQIVEPRRPDSTPTWYCDQTGQFSLFNATVEPISLDAFRRGRLPPGAAAELEDRRRRLGLTQRELGRLAGLSQPQIANVIAGRFGLSRFAAARLQSVLKAAA